MRASSRPRARSRAEQLRAVEDKAIAEIVKFQQDVGLQSITDGEFRRTYFHIDFLEQLGGVKTDIPVTISKPDGSEELAPPVMRVIDKVRHVKDIQRADFEYLKCQVAAGMTPKVTIPSPTMLHFRGGRAGISREAYPELEPDFYDDVAQAYGDELQSAVRRRLPLRADGRHQPGLPVRREDARGGAPARRRPERAAAPLRRLHQQGRRAASRPGMTLAMHLCRGNFKSTHAAAGNYEPVAEALLSEMNARRLLHGVRRRALGRLPAAALPAQGQDRRARPGDDQVRRDGEARTTLKRRIDEAAKYAPLEQLALSPQCGFSSTVHGNNIAVEAQRDKLRLVVETAAEVWG